MIVIQLAVLIALAVLWKSVSRIYLYINII